MVFAQVNPQFLHPCFVAGKIRDLNLGAGITTHITKAYSIETFLSRYLVISRDTS
jgi:hypothetical protein